MSAAVVEQIPLVQRVCRQRLGWLTRPPVDWQDASQDALISLLQTEQGHPGRSVTPGVATMAARWRCGDAQRVAVRDYIRAGIPLEELVQHPPARVTGPEEQAVAAELRRRLRDLVDELPARQRLVIICRFDLDMSTLATAAAVGTSPGAVKVAQHRAIARLRTRISGGAR